MRIRRPAWVIVALAAAAAGWGLGVTPLTVPAQRAVTPPPPACIPNLSATPSETEGPYYKANTPERTSLLEPGMSGTRIIVTGYVYATTCMPITRAWLDFWHANDRGEYDTAGYRLRGHQFTDNAGIYYLETIAPAVYSRRTRHIHVKVRAPNGTVLTTQLYFPAEPRNQTDGLFNSRLMVAMQDVAGVHVATFNFFLRSR